MIFRTINILLFILLGFNSFAQGVIEYSRDYEFKEGIYLNIEMFKQNTPILKSQIITSIPKEQADFFSLLTELKVVKFKDIEGKEISVDSKTLWGFCQNRSIYINFNNSFNRLNVIGSLCHFTSTVIVQGIGYNDPMNYNYGINNTYQELRQFVFDTQNNKVLEFNATNMELLLKNDDELHVEFIKLKKGKRNDSIFIYLRKYNQKHPLYLAEN